LQNFSKEDFKVTGVLFNRTAFILSFYHYVKYLSSNTNSEDWHKNASSLSYNVYFTAVKDYHSTVYSKTSTVKLKVIR
jgi:hypothetical protein